MIYKDNFLFFWKPNDFLSSSHISLFEYKNITFNCVNQFVLYSKAMQFGDTVSASRILKELEPKRQTSLGLKIKGVDEELWMQKQCNIVYVGYREKFMQSLELFGLLLDTEDYFIAQTTKEDWIGGIGLSADDDDAIDISRWQGMNIRGNALMKVRRFLKHND